MRQLTVEYQNLSGTVKSGLDLDRQIDRVGILTSAFSAYGGIVEDVYKNQISQQRDILDEMKNYETNQRNIVKQAANVTETEMKYNEAKLANFRSYYDELKKMQKGYYDAAVKAAQDIANIEKAMISSRRQTADLQYNAWDKGNPAANEMEQYYRDASRLDQKLTAAMTLSAEERVKALSDIQNQYAGLSKQITTTETERRLISSGEGFNTLTDFQDVAVTKTVSTYDEVSKKIAAIGDAIALAQQQMVSDAVATRDKALAAYASLIEPIKAVESEIMNVKSTLVNLDHLLAQQRILTIDVSGALSGLRLVRDNLIAISGYSAQQLSGGSTSIGGSYAGSILTNSDLGSNWDGSPQVTYYQPEPYVLDEYAQGTSYVPRTGPYLLHEGERVTPAEENKARSSSSPISISFGNIVIQGANKDARQIAREIAPEIRAELKRLEYMQ